LDPDAPIRLNKPLHDLDQKDEYKLMEYIYFFIRSGQHSAARDLCFKVGQAWRAATLEGGNLFSDPNYSSDNNNENVNPKWSSNKSENYLKPNEGNLNRDLWKLIVNKLIKDVIVLGKLF
jgi:nuclear pore complex protein Nup107